MTEQKESIFLSVVIPVYNEQNCIYGTLKTISSYLQTKQFHSEIIIVDDGSTDNTVLEVKRFIQESGVEIRILRNEKNCGKGKAVNVGVREATGEYILLTDADLSTPIEQFNTFLEKIYQQKEKIIIGSRRISGAHIEVHQPYLREFLGRGFTILSNLILSTNYSDFTCGFKCFKREVAKLIFSKQTIWRWGYDAEILYLARRMGISVREVPVLWRNNPNTKVKLLYDTIFSFLELLKIKLVHKKCY